MATEQNKNINYSDDVKEKVEKTEVEDGKGGRGAAGEVYVHSLILLNRG